MDGHPSQLISIRDWTFELLNGCYADSQSSVQFFAKFDGRCQNWAELNRELAIANFVIFLLSLSLSLSLSFYMAVFAPIFAGEALNNVCGCLFNTQSRCLPNLAPQSINNLTREINGHGPWNGPVWAHYFAKFIQAGILPNGGAGSKNFRPAIS